MRLCEAATRVDPGSVEALVELGAHMLRLRRWAQVSHDQGRYTQKDGHRGTAVGAQHP